MEKEIINSETVTKVSLIIDLAVLIANGVKRIISIFKKDKNKWKEPTQSEQDSEPTSEM